MVWSARVRRGSLPGMSLGVDVFVRDASGQMTFPREGGSLAAGFESWRTEVWASPQVRRLGAEFFPRLAIGDLYLEPGQVRGFQRGCALLREHVDAIAAGVDLSAQKGHLAVDPASGQVIDPSASREVLRGQILLRLHNIEVTARRALEVGGGVVIW